jgi:hypothetical protein
MISVSSLNPQNCKGQSLQPWMFANHYNVAFHSWYQITTDTKRLQNCCQNSHFKVTMVHGSGLCGCHIISITGAHAKNGRQRTAVQYLPMSVCKVVSWRACCHRCCVVTGFAHRVVFLVFRKVNIVKERTLDIRNTSLGHFPFLHTWLNKNSYRRLAILISFIPPLPWLTSFFF